MSKLAWCAGPRAAWFVVAMCAASACAPEYRSGQLRCNRRADCPNGWTCALAEPDALYRRCYAVPPSETVAVRAGDADIAPADAVRDAAVDSESPDPEASTPDTGPRDSGNLKDGGPDAGDPPPRGMPVETGPFAVVSRKPAPGETLDDPNAALTLTLSADPDPRTVRPGTFTVTRAGREVQGELSVRGRVVSFKPKELWVLSAAYVVTLTDGLRDLAQRPLAPAQFELWMRAGAWSRYPIATRTATEYYDDPRIVLSPSGVAALAWTAYYMGSRHAAPATSLRAPDGTWSPMEMRSIGFIPAFVINDLGHIVLAHEASDSNASTRLHYYSDVWTTASLWNDDGVEYGAYATRDVSIDAMDEVSLVRGYDSLTAQRGSFGTRLEGSTTALQESSGVVDAKVVSFGYELVAVWSRIVDPDAGMTSSVWATNPAAGVFYCSTDCAPTRLSSAAADARDPALAVDPARQTAIAAWIETDDTGSSVRAARCAGSNAAWSESRTVARSEGAVSAVELAMDERGAAVAVWLETEGSSAQVVSAVFDPNTGNWGTPESLSGFSEEVATAPVVAMERRGNALASWTQHSVVDSAGGDVRWARYVAGKGWLREVSVLSVMPQAAGTALSLGMDARGRGVAAWVESETVWVAEYE